MNVPQQHVNDKENDDRSEATAPKFFGSISGYQSSYKFIHCLIFGGIIKIVKGK